MRTERQFLCPSPSLRQARRLHDFTAGSLECVQDKIHFGRAPVSADAMELALCRACRSLTTSADVSCLDLRAAAIARWLSASRIEEDRRKCLLLAHMPDQRDCHVILPPAGAGQSLDGGEEVVESAVGVITLEVALNPVAAEL